MLSTIWAALFSALIASVCAANPYYIPAPQVEFSATQTIDSVPGPFISKIYSSGKKERQEARLGGKDVVTIIRHDKGVAWLLIPSQKRYQELNINDIQAISIQNPLTNKKAVKVGQESVDNRDAIIYKVQLENIDEPAYVWVSKEGITLKANIPEDKSKGLPKTMFKLDNIQVRQQEKSLFELPGNYQKTVE